MAVKRSWKTKVKLSLCCRGNIAITISYLSVLFSYLSVLFRNYDRLKGSPSYRVAFWPAILKSFVHWELLKACVTKKTITIFVYWRDIAPTTLSRSQTLLNMNIEGKFEVSLWRHRRRHHHGKYVFWHFRNGCHFEARHFFYCKRYQMFNIPARQPWTFWTFWVFHRSCKQILRDMSVQNFGLFWELMTSSMMSWIQVHMNIYNHNPMIYTYTYSNYNDIFVRYIAKMKDVLISLMTEYRGLTLRPPCDVITIKRILFLA